MQLSADVGGGDEGQGTGECSTVSSISHPVAKAKILSRHTSTKNAPQALFLGVFRLFPPVIVLKTTRHRGKYPEVSLHSAPAHEVPGSRTSLLHEKK
jgi:hypothetical protein